jgi:microcystin-dependent protein
MGMAPSGTVYNIGQGGGSEHIQLSISNLPSHSHLATSPAHDHTVSVPAHTHPFVVPAHTHPFALSCNSASAAEPSPEGNVLGNSGSNNYDTTGGQQMAGQNTNDSDGLTQGTTGNASGTSGNSGGTAAVISVQNTGGSMPFAPTPLYTTLNYIIAYSGIFPTRG